MEASLPIGEVFYKQMLNDFQTLPCITIAGKHGKTSKLSATVLNFDSSVILENISTTALITSSGHVALINCPEVGVVQASGGLLIEGCFPRASLLHSKFIRYNTIKPNVLTDEIFLSINVVKHQNIYLINTTVEKNVVFRTEQGEIFKGNIFLDPSSRIGDLPHTYAVITILPKDEIEKLIEADKGLIQESKTVKKEDTKAPEEDQEASPSGRPTQELEKLTQAISERTLPE